MKNQYPAAAVQAMAPFNGLASLALLLALMLGNACCYAQPRAKSPVARADYKLWSELMLDRISEDGDWVSYSLRFDDADTIVVRSTGTAGQHALPAASNGSFLGHHYLYQDASGEVGVLDLKQGTLVTLPGSSAYHLLGRVGWAVEYTDKRLAVMDRAGNAIFVLETAQFHAYSAKKGLMVYSQDSGNATSLLARRIIKDDQPWEVSACVRCSFSAVAADDSESAVAFLQHHTALSEGGASTWVGYYSYGTRETFFLKPGTASGFPDGYEPASSSFTRLGVSADGKRVFVGLSAKNKAIIRKDVVIWSNSSKFLSPVDAWEYNNRMGVWWPATGRFEQLTDSAMAHMMLSGDRSHALLYDPLQYEPQPDREGPSDIYIRDLETGSTRLLLERQYNIYGTVSIAPYGKYIAYFRKGSWHVYDTGTRLHRNVTGDIAGSFSDAENDQPEESPPFGVAGWLGKGDALLLYDRLDIWSIPLKGGPAAKITDGSTHGLTFRVVPQSDDQSGRGNYNGPRLGGSYSGKDGIVLSAMGREANEYHLWNPRRGTTLLVRSANRLGEMLMAGNGKAYAYLEQNHNMPPRVGFKGGKRQPAILYKSNPQHDRYLWGNRSVISYRNSRGDDLHGILYFPAGYDPARRYPMVVHVYQVQSHQANNYIRPTDHNTAGLNIANLQAGGYIVFLPDIRYVIGEPGPSALDCVLAGLSRAEEVASVDKEKIALVGHSFGGFEAAYIIAHSDVFATALLGSAITDFSSSYFYVNPHLSNPNFWRYEYGQFRMGRSFFEDKEGYYANSPITSAEDIKVPVLIWAGQLDRQVHYFQGTALYLALRRLGRPAVLLLYPDQGHVMIERERQDDLTSRVEGWLAHYLKDGPKPDWMK